MFYNIRYAEDRELLKHRLDASICFFCKTPRDKKVHETFLTGWHCKGCNVPQMLIEQSTRKTYRRIGKYCSLCYQQDCYYTKQRRHFKREVALEREIISLS